MILICKVFVEKIRLKTSNLFPCRLSNKAQEQKTIFLKFEENSLMCDAHDLETKEKDYHPVDAYCQSRLRVNYLQTKFALNCSIWCKWLNTLRQGTFVLG